MGGPGVGVRTGQDSRRYPVDVGEPIEPADGGEPPVDGGRGQSPLFEPAPVGLDVWTGGAQDVESGVAGPLEEVAEVVPVGIEGAPAVAGEERCGSDVRLIDELGCEPGDRGGPGHDDLL